MTGLPEPELTPIERALLADAVEGTFLIEISRDTEGSVEEYRALVGAAIERLVLAGLVDVSAGPWGGAGGRPVPIDKVRRRVADGTAWDDAGDDLLILDATEGGRRAMGV